jgi:hypothetical protein
MAHFANVNSDNVVTQVLVVSDADAHRGHDFLANDLGLGGTWIQTSYNTRGNVHYGSDGNPDGGAAVRGNYAGIGFKYDPVNDVFYPSQPYPSWTISAATNWIWTAPVPYPTDGKMYYWDEDTTNWVLIPSLSGAS